MVKTALILAPHPDDECITGLLPLRLREECGFDVRVVPMTWGSDPGRRTARKSEFSEACRVLDFQPVDVPHGRDGLPAVSALSRLMKRLDPTVLILPHRRDGHPTHQAAHFHGCLAMDRLSGRRFHVVETEYWHPLTKPNLMVAADVLNLERLCRALNCHAGEVARSDYAARLPAWMEDNVRRGSERVFGRGSAAVPLQWATLYRVRRRQSRRWWSACRGGCLVESSEELGRLVRRWIAR